MKTRIIPAAIIALGIVLLGLFINGESMISPIKTGR